MRREHGTGTIQKGSVMGKGGLKVEGIGGSTGGVSVSGRESGRF